MTEFQTALIRLMQLAEQLAYTVSLDKITPQDAVLRMINAIDGAFPDEATAKEQTIAHLSAQYDEIKKEQRPYELHYASLLANIAGHYRFPKWVGWTNHDLGKILKKHGRNLEAEQAFLHSIAAFGKDHPDFAAVVKGDLGSTLRIAGRLSEAEPLLREALEAALQSDSVHNQLEWRLELGNTLVFMGRNKEVMPILQIGLSQAQLASSLYHESAFLTAIANVYENLGRYDDCVGLHQKALAISHRIGDKSFELEDHRGLGNLYARLGKYQEAEASYQRAYQLAVELKNPALQASLLQGIGSFWLEVGDIEKSIEILEKAVEVSRQLGLHYETMRGLGNLGNAYSLAGDLKRAADYHGQSLQLSRQTSDTRSLAWDLMNLADVRLRMKNITEAQSLAEEALDIASQIDDPLITRSAEWLMARVLSLRSAIPFETIRDHYLHAVEALESPREHVAKDEDRVGLFGGGKHQLYKDAVLWFLEKNNENLAFEMAERAKSRLLLDALSERATGTLSRPANARALLEKVRAAAHNTAYISFFMTTDVVIMFCLSQANSEVHIIQSRVSESNWRGWVEQWRVLLDEGFTDEKSRVASLAETKQALAKLHDFLMHAVLSWLEEQQPAIDHVVIIPHRLMHALPLHLAYNKQSDKYFSEIVEVSYLPALQLLQPPAPVTASYGSILVVSEPETDLEPLPGARDEAKAIAEMLHCVLLSGSEATVEAFRKHAKEASIIHLACHGEFNHIRPGLSYVVLTGNARLSVEEIGAMQLSKLQLVVGAACESGLNRPGGLDEALGLSRGWLLAGATTVLSALWEIDDQATKRFTLAFYEKIKEGASYSKAYCSAQQKLLRGDAFERDPRMWGAFTLICTH